MVKKKLKRWGNNLVIVFTKEDEELYQLAEGDIFNLDDTLFEKIKKRKKGGKK